MGSALYAGLLDQAAADAAERGAVFTVMESHAFDPPGAAIALKLMGAVHRLVLERELPELALHYPSVGGAAQGSAWPPFRQALIDRRAEITALLDRTVQTNEVGRSAALLGGFLEIARRMGLPLALLEIGASAGLNLRWDSYRYEANDEAWGPRDSPVLMRTFETAPDLTIPAAVVRRAGCDPDPVDPATDEGRLTLSSYVWADMTERWERLKGALQVATRVPASVERAPAGEWLPANLDLEPGVATVVYHSVVLQYMPENERSAVLRLIAEAGESATAAAPFAWLRMEPPEGPSHDRRLADVRLTVWPEGEDRLVGRAGYHGAPIRWLGYDG
ncbi:MAG: DUF2332 domain-containing protein [Actinomycetota bacterium]